MALQTMSKFYYGALIPASSIYIAFQEATGPVRIAELRPSSYGLSELPREVQRAMRAAGTQDYEVYIHRDTRRLTIRAPANFSIFISTGPFAGAEIYSILGLGASDLTGQAEYTGLGQVGKEYVPQFFLLDYTPTTKLQEPVDATINETGSGDVEVIRFGTKKFMECTIDFITNMEHGSDSFIETNLKGEESAEDFLQDLTQKRKVEFMPDRNDPETFQTFILESTSTSSQGLGYRLRERVGEKFTGYFTTGLLKFRLME